MKRWFPALPLPCLMLSLLVPRVLLAESEFYAGAGIGYSAFKVDSINFEGTTLATKQFIGYRYGRYVGAEFGFTDFGTVNDQIVETLGQPSINDGIKTWGYNLSLVGSYPLNEELQVFGKAGVLRWDSEATLEGFGQPVKTDGDDLMWGFGMDFRGTNRIHVRVEADFVDIKFANSWWVLSTSVMYGIPFGR